MIAILYGFDIFDGQVHLEVHHFKKGLFDELFTFIHAWTRVWRFCWTIVNKMSQTFLLPLSFLHCRWLESTLWGVFLEWQYLWSAGICQVLIMAFAKKSTLQTELPSGREQLGLCSRVAGSLQLSTRFLKQYGKRWVTPGMS